MRGKKLLACVLAFAMLASLGGCAGKNGNGESQKEEKTSAVSEKSEPEKSGAEKGGLDEKTPDEVTLNIMFRGSRPEGFDDVYEEFLRRTKDDLNIKLNFTWVENADYKEKLNLEIISGADYDLVYDALWLNLRVLAADDYYADLSEYFNNPEYPGLQKAFAPEVMENNKYYGKMCYIPLIRGYGNGVQVVHYRQDWADQWGIGQIDSYEKLEQYWEKAKSENILPVSVRSNRGFWQLFTSGAYYPGAAEAGIMQVASAGIDLFFYVKDGAVQAIAPSGAGDEAFKDFPEGWNYDFTVERYEKFADWAKEGYISPDSMTVSDEKMPYWAGEAASYIGTIDEAENNFTQMAKYSPEAVEGEFVWDDRIREMEDHAIVTNYMSNNGLCVPESSTKKDDTMRFLNWLFLSKENHDLFEMGIEGKDYELTEDGTYRSLSAYPDSFPGYAFTWTPSYVTFSELTTGKNLEYRRYELKEESYVSQPVCGFAFDVTDVDLASYVAQVTAVSEKVSKTKYHGILSDGTRNYDSMREMLKVNTEECYQAGLQNIIDALWKQLDEQLAS